MARNAAQKKTKPEADETPAETPAHIVIAESTMLGDMMNCVLNQVKAIPKPWEKLGEAEQADYLDSIEAQMRNAVRQAVHIINAQERIVIPAMVDKVTFKDGVQAVLQLPKGADGRHELSDAEGHLVQILILDTSGIGEDEGKPQPEKDQKTLPLQDSRH